MNQDEYINLRLEDQIKWYSKKSAINQKKHKFWQVVKILSALMITLLTIWIVDGADWLNYFIGILGAFIVFIESFISIFNYKELWITYRLSSERLQREKLLFLTKTTPYKSEESFDLLVRRCEGIMQEENKVWEELSTEIEN